MALNPQIEYSANASATHKYSFTFPYFKESEIEVTVDNVIQDQSTKYTFPTATEIQFTSGNAPTAGKTIRIYRYTDVDNLKAIFAAGSSIRATDLNNNFDLVLSGAQDRVVTSKIVDDAVTSAKLDTNIDIAGTFDVTGATTLDSTLDVTGASDLSSTLNVDGAATFQDNVTINADNKTFTIENQAGDDKFTVDTDNGNTVIVGTLNAQSAVDFDNNLNIDGTLTVDGTSTLTGAVSAPAGVTGNITGNVTGNVTGDLTGKASHLADAASVTNSEQTGHTANDTTYYTTAASDARYYNIGSTEEIISSETWVSDDASIATTKAVDNRVVNLVDEVGGFVPIVDESKFPATNPDINSDGGTIVSVGTLTASYTPSSGTVTIPASTLTNLSNDLTITGCGTTVLAAGFGVLVETKALSDTAYAANPSYTFHRLTPKSSEVTTVAGIASNVTTVAGIASDVTTVAGKSTEIGRLGTTDAVADLALLGTADVVSDMNTLATADIVSDMNTLATADVVSDMNTLATTANVNNISTVAGIAANVTTVAGNSANVTTVATNNSNITTVAGKISDVESVADNLASVENFNDKYQIDDFSPSAPTTDGGGNAVAEGDLAYDSTDKRLKVYNGSSWESGVAGSSDLLSKTGGQMTGNITMAGSQTVDGRDLSVDGTKLDGIEASAKDDQTGAEIKAAYEAESDTNAFTDADHTKLDGIATSANNYVHPTGAGNKHIPTGGASGQFLKYDSSGTAVWAADNDTTYSVGDGGLTQNNFTNTLKSKLDGIATSANAYVHPNHSGEVTSTADGATVIASEVVDEDNLKVDNSPTNDYVLTAKSSAAGGLTWAAAASGSPEGTAIKSTTNGNEANTKYLRADGDGTCSWQTISSDTDTTYTHTWEDSSDDAILRLTAGGSGSGNDDLTIVAGSNITLTPSGDNLTIAATDTNTQRGIDDTPVDGQTAESISSNWAYDHNAGTGNSKHVPAAGSSGQFLKHDGTWGTPPDTTTPADDSVTGAKLNISLVQGDVIYSSGTDTLARLPKGTAGQALIMNSGATAPEWGAAGATIANDANNRVITADGSAGLNGEANLTFDGSTLALTGNQTATLAVQAQGFECPAEITANWTIAAANNAMFPGPMTVGSSATVTVPTNRTLTVV